MLIPEHHASFIDWPTYESNTAQLRENWRPPRGTGGGPAREGAALLQGTNQVRTVRKDDADRLLRHQGQLPRYVCARAKQLYGGEKGCQSLGGRRLEQRVLAEVFAQILAFASTRHDNRNATSNRSAGSGVSHVDTGRQA